MRDSRLSSLCRFTFRHGGAVALGVAVTWNTQPVFAKTQFNATTVAEVQFNDQFLILPKGQSVNVSRFERGNPVSPGEYLIDLYVNGIWADRSSVRFVARQGSEQATPCFGRALIQRLGLNLSTLSTKGHDELAKIQNNECVNIANLVDGSSQSFDMSEMRLDLSIPQVALLSNPRGYVSPELWDKGVNSATLSYNFNAFRADTSGRTSNQAYLGLNSGVNVGSWHLRKNSAITQSNGKRSYQNIATYVQRDLPSITSQLTIGDSFTDGTVFDSFGIRGVTLASDDRMLPDSLRGYAPLIRGIARSNARVTVTQNGNNIYEINVAPGAFEIKDLYATGYGGNLLVTVIESDGSQHSFSVPYTSVVQLIRPGITRFNLAAGQFRDVQVGERDKLIQGTVQHGFNNIVTGYAGAVSAQNYIAGLIGSAVNTPLGAFAADVTQARAKIQRVSNTTGQSVRISYSKLLLATDTNFSLAAYRYSSSGFWGLRDAMLARDRIIAGQDARGVDRQRNQIQVTMTQNLGNNWGNIYTVGSRLNYWNRPGSTTQFQVGYNNMLRAFDTSLVYNLSLSRQRYALTGEMSNLVLVGLSIPLGRGAYSPTLTTNFTRSDRGGSAGQATLSGSAGTDNEFTYGVSANQSRDMTTGGVSGQYRAPYALLSASASAGSGFSQQSAGISGGVVAHPGGVTFSNNLGDTIGVIDAKGAKGARVMGSSGSRIDGNGYAVVPYLIPYSRNTVAIDPKGTPFDVQFRSTSQQVVPQANSVVMIPFDTVTGRLAVISAHLPNGDSLPFGADVYDTKGSNVGAVGQNSRIFISGVPDQGTLTVKWDDAADESCKFDYYLPPKSESTGGISTGVNVVCRPVNTAAAVTAANRISFDTKKLKLLVDVDE